MSPKTYTRLLFSGLTVPATDGTKTILDATEVFTAGIDGDFKNWGCCATGTPTPETLAKVYELVENATFEEMFGGDLAGRLWGSTAQIMEFVIAHLDMLRDEGWANFFPFKKGKKKFVADACRYSAGQLKANVYRFEYVFVWPAAYRCRIAVPKLAFSPAQSCFWVGVFC